jgi:hypothetical protein
MDPSGPLPETDDEVTRICDDIRRAVRLGGLSYATEQTYVYWNARFTRFCLIRLRHRFRPGNHHRQRRQGGEAQSCAAAARPRNTHEGTPCQ